MFKTLRNSKIDSKLSQFGSLKSKYHTEDLINFMIQKYGYDKVKLYIKNPEFLINNNLAKSENKHIEECPVCDEEKQYFTHYPCNKEHIVCFDCIGDDCYYRCNKNEQIIKTIFINEVYTKFHFFKY